jgi:RNA polymerase sigma-70 factor (ECF subfamily)
MAATQTLLRRSHQVATEAVLVARARLGEEDAIAELVRAHSPRLRSMVWRVVRNWADAQDVVQVALWKACQHLPDYQERAPISTWLTRIALNEGVGLLRRRRIEPIDLAANTSSLEGAQWPMSHHTPSPEPILASKEMRQTVRDCVDRMPSVDRAVLHFRILDELSHAEIAKRLNLSVAAAKTRIHRARVVVRGMLLRRGVDSSGRLEPRKSE